MSQTSMAGYISNDNERWLDMHLEMGEHWLNKATDYQSSEQYQYLQSILNGYKGDYQKTIAKAEKIQKNHPDWVSLKHLDWLYNHEFQIEESIKTYQKLFNQGPHHEKTDIAREIQNVYWSHGLYKEAVDAEIDFHKHVLKQNKNRDYGWLRTRPYLTVYPDFCQYVHKKQAELKPEISLKKLWSHCFGEDSTHQDGYTSRIMDLEMGYWYETQGKNAKAIEHYKDGGFVSREALLYARQMAWMQAQPVIDYGFSENHRLEDRRLSLENDDYHYYRRFYSHSLLMARFKFFKKVKYAKQVILTAPRPEQVWEEIKQSFVDQVDAIQELEDLMTRYEQFYDFIQAFKPD